ncbi:MAG: 30S ribosomal protein S17 [Patescibacteria group bacterium]
MPEKIKIKRQFTGIITSLAMQNTAVVKVDRVKVHPRYHKRYTVSKKYHCDNRLEGLKTGDKVVFIETRPLSKTKRWRIITKL